MVDDGYHCTDGDALGDRKIRRLPMTSAPMAQLWLSTLARALVYSLKQMQRQHCFFQMRTNKEDGGEARPDDLCVVVSCLLVTI